MKTISQKVDLTLALEKDDKRNVTGMQMRVWKMDNETTVVVRLFKHSPDGEKILWSNGVTNIEADRRVLENLKELRVIKNPENWVYSVSDANDFCKQDEYEEKASCYYFCWSVKPQLLQF